MTRADLEKRVAEAIWHHEDDGQGWAERQVVAVIRVCFEAAAEMVEAEGVLARRDHDARDEAAFLVASGRLRRAIDAAPAGSCCHP